ncbi:hypothetical protein [Virgisporangium aurantiacum]|uniref:hypothetical protein n=1 Tax=Virgisporangium aurantiacum TaxID=175570 RepID=UPI00194E8DF3|nr:hypothetical protein [Virgisporangium aurantiacum]
MGGEGQRPVRLVDPDDRAGRADQVGDLEGDVTGAGAEVEHPHARRDARDLQDGPRCGCEHPGLVLQPRQLGRVVSEQICRVCGHARRMGRAAVQFPRQSLVNRWSILVNSHGFSHG